MKDLSVAQEYLLCALNKKGQFSAWKPQQPICFVAGALLDLWINDVVQIQDKNIEIRKELDSSFEFLAPLYEFLKEAKKKTIDSIANAYSDTLFSSHQNTLLHSVGKSLVAAGCADERNIRGILGSTKEFHVPRKECTDAVIQKIRAELLEEGAISDETVALVSLLDKGGLLQQYFSKYESQKLKTRLQEIKDSTPNRMIKEMLEYIDSSIAAIIAVTTMPK